MDSSNKPRSGRPRLVLASTSPFRAELLARLGLPFAAAAPDFSEARPEEPVDAETVRRLVLENARGKARSLRSAYPGSLLLAADQLGECDGRVLSKPGTVEGAVGQLLFLAGREHRLHTAVVVLDAETGRAEEDVVTSPLRMRALSEARIRRYVEIERPLNSAGSYLSERLGIALFEVMGGDDPTAVVGLPLISVTRMLERFGLDPLAEGGA